MSKKVKYKSEEKVYHVKKKTLRVKKWIFFLVIPSFILLFISLFLIKQNIALNQKKVNVNYKTTGNVDYNVYLKDNTYYDTRTLQSGMKYVANLINIINPTFNYKIESDKNLMYTYKYKVMGKLVINDKNDDILYSKDYKLLNEKNVRSVSNNLIINDSINIDYDRYNSYVTKYIEDYKLSATSKFVVTMDIDVEGLDEESKKSFKRKDKLVLNIPLSKQTIKVDIQSKNINEKGELATDLGNVVTNKPLFIISIMLFVISIIFVSLSIYMFIIFTKEGIYRKTVKKILKSYNRLIVNGDVEIDESKFSNKVYPESFVEMVDAAQNLKSPILYYEVVPGEKCFFVIVKGDTLYKYRITKAFLLHKKEEKLYDEEMKKITKK